jgi:hypothetical protein
MLKNWKSLFVKSEETEEEKKSGSEETLSFPVNSFSSNTGSSSGSGTTPPANSYMPTPVNDPIVQEVIEVYESGLESINMPGYDFYEFYKAISSTGQAGDHTYQIAYQMAKSLDKTITVQKLMNDAEFYISKINEVHGQYVNQGQSKLRSLEEKKAADKGQLQGEIDRGSARLSQLRAELQTLEAEMNQKRSTLSKIDESFYPQEKSVREKLNANDTARKASIDKLNAIKEGIFKFIKP